MELNIPLLDAIKQIPKYAKFLKELCTAKRAFKLKGHETVSMGEVVSAIVQKNLPLKQKDPGALCDLGASISVMPKRVIYYFDTPALGRRHQSLGRVTLITRD